MSASRLDVQRLLEVGKAELVGRLRECLYKLIWELDLLVWSQLVLPIFGV